MLNHLLLMTEETGGRTNYEVGCHACKASLAGLTKYASNDATAKISETERSHRASKHDRGRNECRFEDRRSGFGELRKELEACSVTANLLVDAVAGERHAHVDSQTSS
jgi:hypothetical protein